MSAKYSSCSSMFDSAFLEGKGKQVKFVNDNNFGYLRDVVDTMIKECASSGLGKKTNRT